MTNKDVIIKFNKSTSADERQKALDDLVKNGGKVKNAEKIDSSIFPFAVVNMSPDGFSSLQSNLGSHPVIDNAELDSTVHTQ